jgi:hypothetical protein
VAKVDSINTLEDLIKFNQDHASIEFNAGTPATAKLTLHSKQLTAVSRAS